MEGAGFSCADGAGDVGVATGGLVTGTAAGGLIDFGVANELLIESPERNAAASCSASEDADGAGWFGAAGLTANAEMSNFFVGILITSVRLNLIF